MFQGCWKHMHAKQEVDRHANMNQISIRKRQSRKNNETALCVAIHYLNHAHPFCGQYFSFTPSTVVAPQARTHRAVMTFPKHSPIPECSPAMSAAAATVSRAAMQPSNPTHAGDEPVSRRSAHGLSQLPSPGDTLLRLQCRRGLPWLRPEG